MNPRLKITAPLVVGISGRIGSGKDTVAQMVQQLLQPSVTTYVERIAFADALKSEVAHFLSVLSVSLGTCLVFKEKLAQHATEMVREAVQSREKYELFDAWVTALSKSYAVQQSHDIVDTYHSYYHRLVFGTQEEKKPYRELLQLWGTELRRDYVAQNYWQKQHLARVLSVPMQNAHARRWLVVAPDVRFPNEAHYVTETLKGVLIHVERPVQVASDTELAHISENWVPLKADYGDALYTVNNDGSLDDLRTSVNAVLEQIRVAYYGH